MCANRAEVGLLLVCAIVIGARVPQTTPDAKVHVLSRVLHRHDSALHNNGRACAGTLHVCASPAGTGSLYKH